MGNQLLSRSVELNKIILPTRLLRGCNVAPKRAPNGKNQITSMDNGTATYMYDGEDRRMKKTVGNINTFYLYGPGGIISEFSTDTTISTATTGGNNDKTAYQTSDRQGTAVLLIAASGLILENNRTLPYGELQSMARSVSMLIETG